MGCLGYTGTDTFDTLEQERFRLRLRLRRNDITALCDTTQAHNYSRFFEQLVDVTPPHVAITLPHPTSPLRYPTPRRHLTMSAVSVCHRPSEGEPPPEYRVSSPREDALPSRVDSLGECHVRRREQSRRPHYTSRSGPRNTAHSESRRG